MKKTVYIFLVMVLGMILNFIAHALIETAYINSAIAGGLVLTDQGIFGSYCVLPVWLQILLPLAGIIGGFFMGKTWWRMVYIQKRHFWRRKNLKTHF